MDPEAVISLLAIVFVAGMMVGYGIRSLVSKKRRDRARKQRGENDEQSVDPGAFPPGRDSG
jgi:hypothetical protein